MSVDEVPRQPYPHDSDDEVSQQDWLCIGLAFVTACLIAADANAQSDTSTASTIARAL